MALAPLIDAPLLVQLHAGAALTALLVGSWQLLAPKGTRRHRQVGWVWSGLMAVVALSAFGITGDRPPWHFSWIHGLAAFVLVMLPVALLHVRRGRVVAHRTAMLSLFFGALVVTGAFTLLPGRLMGRVVFG